jgi:hypothetical protein
MSSLAASAAVSRPGLWARWVSLLAEREPGTSLALFRIACGLCLLGSVGSVAWHGLVPVLWLGPSDGGYTTPSTPWLFRHLGGVHPGTVWPVVAGTLLCGLALAAGLGGRLTPFLALQGYLALWGLNGDALGGYDWLLTNALWLLVLSRSTATLALDCRLWTGAWSSAELVPAWPRYLAIYQIVLVYWSTGMHKLSAFWTPAGGYSALYYILQEPNWQRWDMSWLAWVYPLTQVATALSWLWEVTAPLLLLVLWYRRTADRPGRLRALCNRLPLRGLWMLVGLSVHLGIALFMNVGPFSWISLSYYLCLFRPEVRINGNTLCPMISRPGTAPAPSGPQCGRPGAAGTGSPAP